MTESFIQTLSKILVGNVAFLGIGNIDRLDDGVGVALARKLSEAGVANVFEGGITPEKILPYLRDCNFDTVVMLDAVEIGAEPGAAVILNAQDISARFPMVSTHKLSLGLLAQLINHNGAVNVWLVGIQPQSIEIGFSGLSPQVKKTVIFAARSIAELTALPAAQEQLCI